MAAKMFNVEGLRESLIHQIPSENEWDESSESDSELLTEFHYSRKTSESVDSDQSNNFFISDDDVTENNGYYLGRDRVIKWCKVPFEHQYSEIDEYDQVQVAEHHKNLLNCKTVIEYFLLFVNNEIFNLIVHYTNIFISQGKSRFTRERDCNDTNIIEVKCFLGLLILIGIFKTKNENYHELWEQHG
ncbi:uncharacterized protein LOC141537279 [Cotesia typhae]|uniref:uncharacterized protein LOC141537279 n=1 Tax=Cotesia typhae TaxID=2053667 RepID=UPI003D6888FA